MLGCGGMELLVSSLAFLLLICFVPITRTASESDHFSCGPGLKTLGVTVPKGDIVVQYGSPLEIFCMLNPRKSRYNSSSLIFYHNEVVVPEEFITRVNETTLRLYVERPPPSTSTYYCKLKTGPESFSGICLNYVFVGYPPMEVQNFTCISHNWESMNCSWLPRHNDIKTYNKLSYYERMSSRKKQYQCPGDTDLLHNYCVWNSSSDPLYRAVLESFFFNMCSWNPLGNITTSYKVDHYAVVVPNKALNLMLIDANPSSLCISWEHPVALSAFPPGIVPRVMYQSKWDPLNYWQVVNTSHLNIKEDKLTLNITGLKYAHTLYDIRVLLRSASAKDEPMWWSEPATITLRTKATVPGVSPKTDIGSFETHNVGSMRDMYIYWQQIPRYMENGDNFEYKVIKVEEFVGGIKIERNIVASKITKTYAKFTNLTNNSYKFSIVSSNKEGYSSDVAHLTVPSRIRKLPEPVSFTKIAHNHGVYELSWGHPNDFMVTSYTIFWCENKQDRPFDCKGYLNWTNIGNVTEKNVTLPEDKIYQFAISANGEGTSSGMLWARCTVLPDQARGKLKNTWINRIGATFIEVSWKLDCFERVRIRGFVLAYCPIRNPQNSSCKEPMRNKTIRGEPTHDNITGLKPYTTYKVLIAVKTSNWEGMWSDPLLNTTLEAAPDMSPENVTVNKVTNTTIQLSWNPPPSLNGVLRYYQIHWNNNITRIEDKSETVLANLTDLRSYELYRISVSACTVACSPNSRTLSITTKIGAPSQLSAPRVKFINSTEFISLSWYPPYVPGGPVNYYSIKVEITDGVSSNREPVFYNTTDISREIPTPECNMVGSSLYYKVYVRAVNIEENGNIYYGLWSPPGEDICYIPTSEVSAPAKVLFAVFGLLFMVLLCFVFGFVTRCAWLRYKAMQNVGVKLPPQLELNIVFKDKSVTDLPMGAHVCSAPLKSHHHSTQLLDESSTPDQQLLLDNKMKDEGSCDSPCDELDMVLETESGEGHVESSGCGSGHDSVSSSITAGTHITDSGTEADERPATPDVFSQSPRRLSDLRQRNITGNSNGGAGESGEGYSRLAAAPTGYITLPPGQRTYVSHAHLWPHNGQQCHKGYVKAPPVSSNTYSKVSLLPATGLKVTSNRDHCADSDNGARSEGQLSINPASSI